MEIIKAGKKRGSIEALEELIQLTPPGLFDMMRIKGLGGRKLHVLWQTAKIDDIEQLLEAAKAGQLSSIPGFGKKTETNIIEAIEAMNSSAELFHFASIADLVDQLVAGLKKQFNSNLVSLCADCGRQVTTVERIEVLAGFSPGSDRLKRFMTVTEENKERLEGHTLDEIPLTIYTYKPENFTSNCFSELGTRRM